MRFRQHQSGQNLSPEELLNQPFDDREDIIRRGVLLAADPDYPGNRVKKRLAEILFDRLEIDCR